MFEQVFDEYRRAVESSFQLQEELYRQWMNGMPVKPADVRARKGVPEPAEDRIRAYQEQWKRTVSQTLEKHRETLNAQYRAGIEAIDSAFRTAEAKTPEECWRLTQEFWRKSIDSFKTAFEAQGKYVQSLAQMWLDLVTKGKV